MNLQNKKFLYGGFIVFATLSVYFFGHIIYWYFNNNNTDTKIVDISKTEIVGKKVQAEEDNTPKLEDLYPFAAVDFTDLRKKNPDTVAWLKVGAVDLNVPIVQTTDNDFYLSHDFDKKKNKLGWVFADARSGMENLGVNTVLYGHNAASKAMFGSLKGLLKTDPEMKETNEIIQFTTLNKEMVFEITSVYITQYDDWKYIQTDFGGLEDKKAFIERMRSKNEVGIFDRKDLSVNDRFLTFSTCYGPAGTTDRLVVHARLVAEKAPE